MRSVNIKKTAPPARYHRRIAMLCPRCNHRICDKAPQFRMEAFLPEDGGKPPWEPDLYMKCKWCGAELELFQRTE